MDSESGRVSSEPESDANSPELLRWRADILLDEMMLGAVDVAAGRPGDDISRDDIELGGSQQGTIDGAAAQPVSEQPPPTISDTSTGGFDANGLGNIEQGAGGAAAGGGDGSSRGADEVQSASSSSAPTEDSILRPPTASLVAAGEVTSPVDNRVESAANTWQRDLSKSSAFDEQESRSNLLPRETQVDVSSRLREIDQLETALDASLPSEHEWGVRSRHLLAKAAHILQHSPERSAEVDYYLQQVRAILERAQQSDAFSKIYIKRLTTYLAAWTLLSAIWLAASLFYFSEISQFVTIWFDLDSDHLLATHLSSLSITLASASLGASIGALRIMGRYRKSGRGYIDRKYSLRCLLLPLLSLLFGLLIYLLFGLILLFANIDPMQRPLISLIPAFLAFLFGLAQEYLYGTAA